VAVGPDGSTATHLTTGSRSELPGKAKEIAMTFPLEPGTCTIDPAHSTVEFLIRHLGLSKVRGRFNGFDARLEVGGDLASTTLEATVDLASVDTNNADRDNHLRSTDFFDTEAHPTLTFTSKQVVERDGEYVVTGDLTLNGVTHPVDLDVSFNGTEIYPMTGKTHAGFTATGEISRKAWGVDFNVPLSAGGVVLGDKVRLEIEAQLEAA
jgi:polyisoprenoid-binding protein YceI